MKIVSTWRLSKFICLPKYFSNLAIYICKDNNISKRIKSCKKMTSGDFFLMWLSFFKISISFFQLKIVPAWSFVYLSDWWHLTFASQQRVLVKRVGQSKHYGKKFKIKYNFGLPDCLIDSLFRNKTKEVITQWNGQVKRFTITEEEWNSRIHNLVHYL